MGKAAQSRFVSILAAIMLLLTYIACGFAVCAGIPATTEKLSLMTSDFEGSPYGHDDLVALAMETRDFTTGDYGRSEFGEAGAENNLATTILERARSSADLSSDTHDRWSAEALSVLDRSDPSPDATIEALYEAGSEYSLNEDAIAHLNDVNDLISRLFMPLLGIAVLAAFCLMVGVRYYGYDCAAHALLYAGCAALVVLLSLGAWALFSFDSMFSALHSIFFPQGNWTFPANSLLIEMYPIGFWVGMGVVWFASSCVISLLSIVFGILMRRAHRRNIMRNMDKANGAMDEKTPGSRSA